jgi:ATP-binding cassette subfamily B multidrug efflux pump
MNILTFFESLILATDTAPVTPPPAGLLPFYAHFLKQVLRLIAVLFLTGALAAVLDASVPVFIGWLVSLVSKPDPRVALSGAWPQILGIVLVLLVLRPLALFFQNSMANQAIAPGLGNLIRWQSHLALMRQNWSFFQNGTAGGLANRVVQTGPCLRETVLLTTNAVLYIAVYGGSAIAVLAWRGEMLALPIVCWGVAYVLLLRHFVPRIRVRSRAVSEVRSRLTGRVVDTYSNILTFKLFLQGERASRSIRSTIDEHTLSFRRHLRLTSLFSCSLSALNALLLVSSGGIAIWLWINGHIAVGTVAMALPLTWQITNVAGWVAQHATSLFENMGAVEDGMTSITAPAAPPDRPGARELVVKRAEIAFNNVHFGYASPVLHGVSFSVAAGEHVGLVGASGEGKSTLMHLLLRLYEVDQGKIVIDGQDIACCTVDSVRRHIAIVPQDLTLMDCSLGDNIRIGRADASDADIQAVVDLLGLEFVEHVVDTEGRRGLDAHCGERGAKLSGGQRQRIAIARAILKDAPILVLDEATSALDENTQRTLQGNLALLMHGRTAIVISHRASSLVNLDRTITLSGGRILSDHAKTGEIALDASS